jgi:membrane protein DedA with SNARE-associated domain
MLMQIIERLEILLLAAIVGMGVGYILARYFGVGGPK